MRSQPLVSVIMNCYNGARYLKEAIQSVYNQDYSDFEIIFWDNNSNDESAKIALDFDSRVKYFFNTTTTNLGSARNAAMNKAKGDYISFLDTDDTYVQNKFEIQTSLMSELNLIMSYGGIRFFKDDKTIWTRNTKNITGYLIENLLQDYEIHMNTVMINRQLMINNNYQFNSNLKYSPDYNLFMKIALCNKLGVINKVIGNSRAHEESLTRQLLHTVPKEHIFTLKEIAGQDPTITTKYKKNYDYSIKKAKYYEAIAYISENKYREARKLLRNIIFADKKYLILYLILFLPLKSPRILTILKR